MPKFWGRLDERMQENATGILGTIAFHLVLIMVFLIIKINTEKNRLENLIVVDFDETPQDEVLKESEPDPEFDEKLARYLSQPRSNIPVNLARRIDRELSTDKYVQELEKDLESNRSDDEKKLQERLKELEEMQKEDIIADGDSVRQRKPGIYEGPTNIFYDLVGRYHRRLPVPVYKCEGSGLIEVKIAVDRKGRVVQAEVGDAGESGNEFCLAEAAKNAALNTVFNEDFQAAARQVGTITYHFIAQ